MSTQRVTAEAGAGPVGGGQAAWQLLPPQTHGAAGPRHLQAGMELRVLHTAAYGCTWYGQWGYTFGRGGYNIQEPVS